MFERFFAALSETLSWRRAEFPAIIRELAARAPAFFFPARLLETYGACGDLARAWGAAVWAASDTKLLNGRELDVLEAFAAVFACPEEAHVLPLCKKAEAAFHAFREEAAADRIRQTRLWLGLGALGAALIVIVLV